MVTGATYDGITKKLALCGYNSWLKPSVLVFDAVSTVDFFRGNARKLKLNKCVRQVEGISLRDNLIYLISESFRFYWLFNRRGELIYGILPAAKH